MLLLDTNVLSELRKVRAGRADRGFAAWADTLDADALFMSAITVMEIEMGILRVERKDREQGAILRAWFAGRVLPEFQNRILAVDAPVALRCARLHVPDPRSERDALIAATALVHGMPLATRNTRDFLATGVSLINPWEVQHD
ncbi:twitching motility protein PilT (plasmid) [Kozakia baliensis]|nr:type II toxin-antitoxin system VapC family toxin [Kozakia baliensis]AOX21683.1 twitching motility protein PilT [Kozakia baliensis]